jgi:uncharacterized lipoprotein YajG
VNLHYKAPTGQGAVVPAASNQQKTVTVNVKSLRKHHDVGGRVNTYDMHMAGIGVNGGVSHSVDDALCTALKDKGFAITPHGEALVHVDVLSFHGEGHSGLFISYRGHTTMRVIVNALDGDTVYSQVFATKVRYGGYLLAGGGGTPKVLNALLNQAVNKIVNDPAFIHALLVARGARTKG